MKIRWDNDRLKWVIYDDEITYKEWNLLRREDREPEYLDNWDCGDVWYYSATLEVGYFINYCKSQGIELEIIF